MAFTKYEFGPHRWQHFNYFATGSAVGSYVSEAVAVTNGGPWKLAEIRLHYSTAVGSVKYINIQVSSILGSAYNALLLSQDLNGVQDIFIQYFEPLLMMSGDTLNIYTSQISVANQYGLQAIGWAVID